MVSLNWLLGLTGDGEADLNVLDREQETKLEISSSNPNSP